MQKHYACDYDCDEKNKIHAPTFSDVTTSDNEDISYCTTSDYEDISDCTDTIHNCG